MVRADSALAMVVGLGAVITGVAGNELSRTQVTFAAGDTLVEASACVTLNA